MGQHRTLAMFGDDRQSDLWRFGGEKKKKSKKEDTQQQQKIMAGSASITAGSHNYQR